MREILSENTKKDYCDTTLHMEEGARAIYLMLGERLYNIREKRLYEPAWSSWQEFTMEFKDLSTASISKIISVYDVFVLQYKFKPEALAKAGGWTKLYSMLKLVHSRADAEKWLAVAETHTRQDFGKFLVEAETHVEMDDCKHTNTYLVKICEDCGLKTREFGKVSPS